MTVDQGGYPPETGSARTLGDTFRATRTSAGVSVEQVESDLRIKAKYIEAIEDGDTVALPSRAYTDGFLRNYATYLGMDPAESVRRFASEQGLSTPTARIAPVAPMPSAKKSGSLSGYASPEPRRGFFSTLGRGIAAAMPLFLVAGIGFGGYTGYVAARDAGLIPPQFGGEQKAAQAKSAPTSEKVEDKAPTRTAAAKTPETSTTDKPSQNADAQSGSAANVEVAEAKSDLVGAETSTGRPDSLTYARTGNTPYWQAKPPAVEPADGPVSEIEPEEAGLLRANASEEEDRKPSRWSSSGANEQTPADVDASRIAAAAREALGGPSNDVAEVTEPAQTEATPTEPTPTQTDVAAAEPAVPTPTPAPLDPIASAAPIQTETVIVQETQVAALDPAVLTPPTPQFGVGPVVVDGQPSDLSPAQPQQAPRRFALIAGADTWVQITDSLGNVTYTGILSPGEAYSIPAQQGLRLKTGNAGGLFIEVDGQKFGPLGSSGAVMRNVVLNPGAVRASFTLSQAASLQQ